MRLVVADSRDHQYNLYCVYPNDRIVCVGDPLGNVEVSSIVNETAPNRIWTGADAEWWEQAHCRVEP